MMDRSGRVGFVPHHARAARPQSGPASFHAPRRGGAFTLIEVLIVIAIIAVLIAILLPALGNARRAGKSIKCLSNQKQLATGWTLYANDYKDRAMPLAYWSAADIGNSSPIYWWGVIYNSGRTVHHSKGFIAPYLNAGLTINSVFECPEQAWGTYEPQPMGATTQTPTSTYGYNGYYLSPSKTPGWGSTIGHRPWRRLFEIQHPTQLAVFADTLINLGGAPRNVALLDPPELFAGPGDWVRNDTPTTAFRHSGKSVVAVRADASALAMPAQPGWISDAANAIGSMGETSAPWHVPDAGEW